MRRITDITLGIPVGLPDHFRNPTIPLDPAADRQNRRLQAYASHADYSRKLSAWLEEAGVKLHPHDVQTALGTTLEAFLAVADSVDQP